MRYQIRDSMTLAELEAAIELAHAEVVGLCKRTRTWRMTVPVQHDDSDAVIGDALRHSLKLVKALREHGKQGVELRGLRQLDLLIESARHSEDGGPDIRVPYKLALRLQREIAEVERLAAGHHGVVDEVIAEMRHLALVAGQASVEEPDLTMAAADARFAEYLTGWVERLAAGRTPAPEPELVAVIRDMELYAADRRTNVQDRIYLWAQKLREAVPSPAGARELTGVAARFKRWCHRHLSLAALDREDLQQIFWGIQDLEDAAAPPRVEETPTPPTSGEATWLSHR